MAPASWVTPRSPEYQGLAVISSLDVAEHDRGHAEVGDARVATDRLLGHLERVLEGGGGFEADAVDFRYNCRNHGSSAKRTSYFDSISAGSVVSARTSS